MLFKSKRPKANFILTKPRPLVVLCGPKSRTSSVQYGFLKQPINRRKFGGLTKVQATGNVHKHHRLWTRFGCFEEALFVTVFIKHALLALSLRFRALEGELVSVNERFLKVFAKPSPDLSRKYESIRRNGFCISNKVEKRSFRMTAHDQYQVVNNVCYPLYYDISNIPS